MQPLMLSDNPMLDGVIVATSRDYTHLPRCLLVSRRRGPKRGCYKLVPREDWQCFMALKRICCGFLKLFGMHSLDCERCTLPDECEGWYMRKRLWETSPGANP